LGYAVTYETPTQPVVVAQVCTHCVMPLVRTMERSPSGRSAPHSIVKTSPLEAVKVAPFEPGQALMLVDAAAAELVLELLVDVIRLLTLVALETLAMLVTLLMLEVAADAVVTALEEVINVVDTTDAEVVKDDAAVGERMLDNNDGTPLMIGVHPRLTQEAPVHLV